MMSDQAGKSEYANAHARGATSLIIGSVALAFLVAHYSNDPLLKRFFDNVQWTVANLGAALLVWQDFRGATGGERHWLRWILWGFVSYALGQCLWNLQVLSGWNPDPAPSDAFYIAFGPLLVTGIWLQLRTQLAAPRVRLLALEMVVLALQITAIVLVVYLINMPTLGWMQLLQLCAYPLVLFGAVVVTALALLVRGREVAVRSWRAWLLPIGLVVSGASWMQWNLLSVTTRPPDGSWLNLAFSAGAVMRGFGAASWRTSLTQPPSGRIGRLLLLLPIVMVSAAVATAFFVLTQPQLPALVRLYVLVGTAVVIVLSVIRQSYWLADREQLLNAERRMHEREQQMLAVAERLEIAVSAAHFGIWDIDLTRRHAVWDANMYAICGYAPECGLDPHTIWEQSVPPDDLARVRNAILTAAANRAELQVEFRLTRPDGSLHYLEAFGKPGFDSAGNAIRMTGVSWDVTDRVIASRALAGSEAELRAIFDNSVIGVVLIDAQRNIIRHNRAVRDFLGYDLQTAATLKVEDILHPDEQQQARAQFAELLSGQRNSYQVERRYLHQNGAYWWVRVSVYPVQLHDKRCFVVLVEDIEARKKMQMELETAQAKELRLREEFAFNLLNVQEQERMRIANELHDGLGQSLSLIRNRAQLALEGLPAGSTAVPHIQSLIRVTGDAIAETRRMSHNLRPLHLEQLGLTAALKQMVEEFADANGIETSSRLENMDDAFMPDQVTHVYRLVQEALNNVSKHARAKHLRVLAERDLHAVRIRIEDDGRGFDPAAARQAGLGLTSMTERAHMLGGRLKIESRTDSGTVVMMELPVHDREPVPAGKLVSSGEVQP